MKSTAPAFRYFGDFEEKAKEYTVGYYTNELTTTIATTANATMIVNKICEYAVERNKTKQMSLQYAEIEAAYETQIEEERKQMQIILSEYEQQLAIQMQTNQRQLELALEHYRKVIEQLVLQNNFTLQKLKRSYNLKVQILQPLYKHKDMLYRFYNSVQAKGVFEQVNQLGDSYADVVKKIMDIEKNIIEG